MKRTFSALVISGALLCTLAVPGMAAEAEGQPGASAAASAPQAQTLPASVLYFGQVTQVIRDEAGTVTRLVLFSERYGEYIMNISSDTVWIDSGNRTASDPADLKEGESVYVFHSPISTRSLQMCIRDRGGTGYSCCMISASTCTANMPGTPSPAPRWMRRWTPSWPWCGGARTCADREGAPPCPAARRGAGDRRGKVRLTS